MMLKFKFFSHTADIKFRAYGKSLDEVFKNSSYALINSVVDSKIEEKKKLRVKVKGKDIESLLYNFLEEILFLIDSKHFFVSKIKNLKIDKKNFKISAEFYGDNGKNLKVFSHVKAITYSEMFVKKIKNKWISQVVLDI
ncbi:archease [archaeon]|nr:archease [archaeon]PJC45664.1 MAG: hypothetical protein CO037_00260 [Candidatus Pacearchaeota archaeon CG_4_9_14_0_2_um_filter_30_8]